VSPAGSATSGHTCEGTEACVFCDRTCHWSGAEADTEADQGQVCQPVVGEQRGGRVLDVLDVGFGVLKLPRLAVALAEVPVIERERRVPALGIAWAYVPAACSFTEVRGPTATTTPAGVLPSGRNKLPTNVSSSLLNIKRVFVAVSMLLELLPTGC
jgi:hypothetical protein